MRRNYNYHNNYFPKPASQNSSQPRNEMTSSSGFSSSSKISNNSQNADSGENSPEIVKTKKPRWRYLQTNDPKRYGKYKLLLNFGKYADNDSA
ncbi:unnamed protein product [Oikopleura dioica]|uniref:Uncharacterized protein n=1 Tax=Oikopleura dioica TaxID=34765 RepID=E4XSX2_OIKDI|nr:unnamed protein product [Oikopleura dioica]